MATILTKRSNTASSVPFAADLTNSTSGAELAVNTADKRLFTKDSGGTVVELGTNPSSLTLTGGTANGVAYLNGSKVLTTGSALTFDGTKLGVGTSSPSYRLDAVSASGVAAQITSGTGGVSTIFKNLSSGTSIVQFTGTTTTNPVSLGAFGDVFILNTSGSERLRIDSSGNLGLGVTPNAWDSARAFQFGPYGGSLAGSTGQSGIYLNSNVYYASGAWRYATTGTATQYKQNENTAYGGHSWLTAPSGTAGNAISFTQAMTLDASGNLLVGTTTAAGKLSVEALSNVARFWHTDSSDTIGVYMRHGRGLSGFSGKMVSFRRNDDTEVGSIVIGASSTSYNTSSDYRLKENIAPMTGALALVRKQRPVTYRWKADGSDGEGYIAHWLQEDGAGNCVTGTKDAVDAEGKPVYQGIDTSFMVPKLNAALNELADMFDALKAEFDAYKASHP
jgi:hypothetical protein